MKIFAIRDRLLDYYLVPFAAPTEKDVMASLAQTINLGDTTSAIAQAPHHFELWQLALVGEDGYITPEKTFLADCSSFVRTNIRHHADGELARATKDGETDRIVPATPEHPRGLHNAHKRTPTEPTRPKSGENA